MRVDFRKYDNAWYKPGGSVLKRLLWYVTNVVFLINPLNPFSGLKIFLLRLFGARIGRGVRINPAVNIKYPWHLVVGDYTWIGERVWIDNLVKVKIGSHCCLSQGAVLLTGNHDYKRVAFDLIVKEIVLEDGVWIGAGSMICPGVVCRSHAVLAVQSVANKDLEAYTVHQGNPAVAIRKREMEDKP